MKKIIAAMSGAVLLAAAATGVAGAAPPQTVEGFVCPVLGGQAGLHGNGNGPFVQLPSGEFTILGPEVVVPVHATNDNGAGTPGGAHAAPGDSNYSAIWGVR